MRFLAIMVTLWLAAIFPSHNAEAALVNEGEYTLDTDTGLEWLDPALTDNLSYGAVLAGAGGWTALGWEFASVDQFAQLASTYVAAPDFFNQFVPPRGGLGVVGYDYFDAAWSVITTLDASYTTVTRETH